MEDRKQKIRTFRDLTAWQEAHRLAVMIYKITSAFPRSELFGIVNQMRRAAVSVVSNIAEGFCRASLKEKIQFYTTALGSLSELQSQLLLSKDVGFLHAEKYAEIEQQTVLVSKLLNGLIKSIRSTANV